MGTLGGVLVTEEEARQIAEAQTQVGRYLSDEIAPMIFADAAEILFIAPPEIMAREVHSWVGVQLQGPHASPISDSAPIGMGVRPTANVAELRRDSPCHVHGSPYRLQAHSACSSAHSGNDRVHETEAQGIHATTGIPSKATLCDRPGRAGYGQCTQNDAIDLNRRLLDVFSTGSTR